MQFCMENDQASFDWEKAKAFHLAAQLGSFSAAARALGLAQPTVGRQVAALEEELGVVLLERVGSGIQPTQAGLDLLGDMKAMADAADRIALSASGKAVAVEGKVRISATDLACTYQLPQMVAKLNRLYPKIRIELISTNSISDLRRREADIALRGVRPTDNELYARKIYSGLAYLYAARSYLDRAGGPFDAKGLASAQFVEFEDNPAFAAALQLIGVSVGPENFVAMSSSHVIQWEMTKAGLGIIAMPAAIGDLEPLVARAAPSLPGIPFDLWLVAHREVKSSKRIRVVYDFLAEQIEGLMHEPGIAA